MRSRQTVKPARGTDERYYVATQWTLIWRKLRKHRLAILGGGVLFIFYLVVAFAEFLSPHGLYERSSYIYCPPQRVRFVDQDGRFHLRPFVHGLRRTVDAETLRRIYTEDRAATYPIRFFVHGSEYKFWNLFVTDVHLFGTDGDALFLFGTDGLGRDLFSRNLSAFRISLSIGLVGVAISFVIGCLAGGISGYYSGTADVVIQRLIEFLLSIPKIPLWMALSAALPPKWPPIKVYFGITVILSVVGWCGLARVVRGRVLEVRKEDYVTAAMVSGCTTGAIIRRHLLPSMWSYLIISITLSIPGMILGETSLSFLGIGLRPPVVSWGVLLQDAQNLRTVALHPWLLIPGVFVVITVLAFNFLGDGLRDAADPYS